MSCLYSICFISYLLYTGILSGFSQFRVQTVVHNRLSIIMWVEVKLIVYLQIEILLVKTDKFEELMAAEAEEKEFAADGEEQNWARGCIRGLSSIMSISLRSTVLKKEWKIISPTTLLHECSSVRGKMVMYWVFVSYQFCCFRILYLCADAVGSLTTNLI